MGSEISLPRSQFDKRPPDQAHLTPVDWVKLCYAAEIASGDLHWGVIRRSDPRLYKELRKWVRKHPLPPDLPIPTLPEWNTKQLNEIGNLSTAALLSLLLKKGDPETRRYIRLYEVAKKRPKPDAA